MQSFEHLGAIPTGRLLFTLNIFSGQNLRFKSADAVFNYSRILRPSPLELDKFLSKVKIKKQIFCG